MSALPSTTSRAGGGPPPIEPELGRRLHALTNRLIPAGRGYEIAATDAPAPALRHDLQERAGALDRVLAPAGRGALDEITSVFMMPSREVLAEDLKKRMVLYESDLADLPFFALAQACADFRQGRAGDGWRPTQADIRKRAERHAQPLHAERRRIGTVLSATVLAPRADPERRKAVADRARAVARSIAMEASRAESGRCGLAGGAAAGQPAAGQPA